MWLLLLAGCVFAAIAQGPLVTIDVPDAGRIVYGKVDGADNFTNAFTIIENELNERNGAKLRAGRAFRIRGCETEGVFFILATTGAQGERIAGLILAVSDGKKQSEQKQMQAAILTDKADRFGKTINPMLAKLFGVWHPAGLDSAIELHTVELDDKSASVGLPEGWMLEPGWSGGAMMVTGPHDERIVFDRMFIARDPKDPTTKLLMKNSAINKNAPKFLNRPYDEDLGKAFPDILQQIRKDNGQPPVKLIVEHTESIPAQSGERCIHVTGTVDPDGKGDHDTEFYFCSSRPMNGGMYMLQATQMLLPKVATDQDRAVADAIEGSFQSNMPLVAAREEEAIRSTIPEHGGGDMPVRFTLYGRIRELEEDAKARESAGWYGRFLLDRSLIHAIEDAGQDGAAWVHAADLWKQAYPYRIEDAPAEAPSLVMFDSAK